MTSKKPFTAKEAAEFLLQHDLGFLDICELALAFAAQMPQGMIKWNHPRVLVHIKAQKKSRGEKP